MNSDFYLGLIDQGSRMLIPGVAACAFIYRKNLTRRSVQFVVYLLLYFLFNIPSMVSADIELRWLLHSVISLFESLFLICFSLKYFESFQKYRFLWCGAIVTLWALSYGKLWWSGWPIEVSPFFNTISNASLALMSAIILFRMTAIFESITKSVEFWFFCGIFVYKFSTVFLVAYIPFSFHHEVWYLHSLYFFFGGVFYFIGFCQSCADPQK
ncbi:MAG: hypothetical protein ACK50N_02265 [Flavobacteriales bacterium]|jgi:hypothetical protein